MKDLFGNEIFVGATVAFTPPYSRELARGTVLRLTPLGATIEWDRSSNMSTDTYSARANNLAIILKAPTVG